MARKRNEPGDVAPQTRAETNAPRPEPVVVQPARLPPPTGERCTRCDDDLLDDSRFGSVCRSGHAPSCSCFVHEAGVPCEDLAPAHADVPRRRPLTLEVRSRVPAGHRRAGRAWSATWTAVPSSFAPAQLEKLRADPHLQVRVGHSKDS